MEPKLSPLNKHYFVEILENKKDELIYVPKTEQDAYVVCKVLNKSHDCEYHLVQTGSTVVVMSHMIETFHVKNEKFCMVPESAICGVFQ